MPPRQKLHHHEIEMHHQCALFAHQSSFGDKFPRVTITKFSVIKILHIVQINTNIVEFT